MGTPTDEQVKSYIESVPGLREEWGISGALRLAKVTFIVMNVLLIAVIIGVIAYFAFTSPELSTKGVSGLIIILVLAYAASVVRIFQLRAERKELPRFRRRSRGASRVIPKRIRRHSNRSRASSSGSRCVTESSSV